MSKAVIHCNSQEAKQQILENAISLDTNGAVEVTFRRLPKTRTGQQRKAIEVYCRELASAFNDAGISVQEALQKTMECDWSQELVKAAIFRRAGISVCDKKSTADLNTDEVSKVFETVNRFAAQFGIHVPFPEREK